MDIHFVPPEEYECIPEFCKDCKDYHKGCGTCSQLITLKQDLTNWRKQIIYSDD